MPEDLYSPSHWSSVRINPDGNGLFNVLDLYGHGRISGATLKALRIKPMKLEGLTLEEAKKAGDIIDPVMTANARKGK